MEVRPFNPFNPMMAALTNSKWICEYCKNVHSESTMDCLRCGANRPTNPTAFTDNKNNFVEDNSILPPVETTTANTTSKPKLVDRIKNMGEYLKQEE